MVCRALKGLVVLSLVFQLSSGGMAQAETAQGRPQSKATLAPWLDELNESCVLFVPGFLSDAIRFGSWFSPLEYFDQQIKNLKRQGVNCIERVDIESEASSLVNQSNVLTAIEKVGHRGRSVILVTHSKGGVDALEGFITDVVGAKRVLPFMRGWISLQAPFAGTPAADWLIEGSSYVPEFLARGLLTWMGGDMGSVVSLSTERRKIVLAVYQSEIRQLNRMFPIISVATRARDPGACTDYKTNLVLGKNLRLLMAKGIESDGLVPVESAHLPRSQRIFIDGIDHAATVMDAKCSTPPFDRVEFLNQTIIRLLRPAGQSPQD